MSRENLQNAPLVAVCVALLGLPQPAYTLQTNASRPAPSESIEAAPPSIEKLIDGSQLAQAQEAIQKLLAAEGETARSLLLEAMILYKQQSFRGSLEKLQRSLTLDETNPQVHKLIGLNLVAMNRQDLSGRYFQRAADLSPQDHMARYYLGMYHLTERRFDKAESHFQQVVALNPDYVDGYRMLALAREEQGNHEGAIATYRQAIQVRDRLATRNEAPELFLGRLFIMLERFEESVPVLEKAVDVNPDSKEAWLSLGQALAKLDQDQQALAALQRAARLDPKDKSAHYQMIRVFKKLGQPEDAAREQDIFRRLQAEERKKSRKK